VLALLAAAAPASRGDDDLVENADYEAWAHFKAGSSVTYAEVNQVNSRTTHFRFVLRLKELTQDKAVLEFEHYTLFEDSDKKMLNRKGVQELPAKLPKLPASTPDPDVKTSESEETLTVM